MGSAGSGKLAGNAWLQAIIILFVLAVMVPILWMGIISRRRDEEEGEQPREVGEPCMEHEDCVSGLCQAEEVEAVCLATCQDED